MMLTRRIKITAMTARDVVDHVADIDADDYAEVCNRYVRALVPNVVFEGGGVVPTWEEDDIIREAYEEAWGYDLSVLERRVTALEDADWQDDDVVAVPAGDLPAVLEGLADPRRSVLAGTDIGERVAAALTGADVDRVAAILADGDFVVVPLAGIIRAAEEASR